jgi:hypothetical protein
LRPGNHRSGCGDSRDGDRPAPHDAGTTRHPVAAAPRSSGPGHAGDIPGGYPPGLRPGEGGQTLRPGQRIEPHRGYREGPDPRGSRPQILSRVDLRLSGENPLAVEGIDLDKGAGLRIGSTDS